MDPLETAKVIKDIIPVKEAYCDAIQPGAKQLGRLGETTGMVVNALLSPIRKFVFNIQAREVQLESDITAKLSGLKRTK